MALIQKTRTDRTERRGSETHQDHNQVLSVRTSESNLEVSQTAQGFQLGAAQPFHLKLVCVSPGRVHSGSGLREQNQQDTLYPRSTVWVREQDHDQQDQEEDQSTPVGVQGQR